jgi:hypothetical protein
MADVTTFRDAIQEISPPWLAQGAGQRIMYLPGVLTDALTQAALDGVKARFPGYGTPEALTYIGADRQIVRGPNEPDDSYVTRLRIWLDSWRHAGSPYGLLPQLEGLSAPAVDTWRTVDNSSNWHWIDAGDTSQTISVLHVSPHNWNWDGDTTDWARFWAITYRTPKASWYEGTWGDGDKWGNNAKTWGLNMTPSEIKALRAVCRNFKAAHSTLLWIIVSFDTSLFIPGTAYPSATLPDGTWGPWSKAVTGNRVQSRSENARYIGSPI